MKLPSNCTNYEEWICSSCNGYHASRCPKWQYKGDTQLELFD